ncbi:hypothetical protein [Pajaroellobacter abortibovis]|uniref:hypothetical protein n=1 Tax=Pajaroellobacter abortibovis TaxID=1882918 RepID=UPI0012EB7612
MPKAIQEYRKAISLDPILISAWINSATALAKDPKEHSEAYKALEKASRLDPTDPRVQSVRKELDEFNRSP